MNIKQFLELTLLAAIWGASFLFMRIASPELGPVMLMTLRVVIATLCLLPVIFFTKQVKYFRGQWQHLLVVGFFSTALPFTLFGYATLHLAAGLASVLNTTTPMFGVIIAFLWFKEKISWSGVIGLMIGFIGIYLLLFEKIHHQQTEQVLLPTLAILLATFCYAFAANYAKCYLSTIKPMVQATGSLISASIILLPISCFFIPDHAISNQAIISILLLGTVCTGIAYIIFFRLLAKIGPNNTISVTYLIPIFGIMWGSILLQEQITSFMITGVIVVLLGVSLSTGLLKNISKVLNFAKITPVKNPK
ncbi:MAG: DMT family transporter [Thalassotalea sp.]